MKVTVIKSIVRAAKYSGCDVWLVPAAWNDNKLQALNPHWKEVIKHKMSNEDMIAKGWNVSARPYIGDDWSITNENIYGHDDEICFIVRVKA